MAAVEPVAHLGKRGVQMWLPNARIAVYQKFDDVLTDSSAERILPKGLRVAATRCRSLQQFRPGAAFGARPTTDRES
jgi:hypothetical protein